MTEYITKEQAKELACRACEYTCYGEWERCGVKEWADDIPTADVQPVVHGEWEKVGTIENTWLVSKCSVWGSQTIDAGCYCPNCGARMVRDDA